MPEQPNDHPVTAGPPFAAQVFMDVGRQLIEDGKALQGSNMEGTGERIRDEYGQSGRLSNDAAAVVGESTEMLSEFSDAVNGSIMRFIGEAILGVGEAAGHVDRGADFLRDGDTENAYRAAGDGAQAVMKAAGGLASAVVDFVVDAGADFGEGVGEISGAMWIGSVHFIGDVTDMIGGVRDQPPVRDAERTLTDWGPKPGAEELDSGDSDSDRNGIPDAIQREDVATAPNGGEGEVGTAIAGGDADADGTPDAIQRDEESPTPNQELGGPESVTDGQTEDGDGASQQEVLPADGSGNSATDAPSAAIDDPHSSEQTLTEQESGDGLNGSPSPDAVSHAESSISLESTQDQATAGSAQGQSTEMTLDNAGGSAPRNELTTDNEASELFSSELTDDADSQSSQGELTTDAESGDDDEDGFGFGPIATPDVGTPARTQDAAAHAAFQEAHSPEARAAELEQQMQQVQQAQRPA